MLGSLLMFNNDNFILLIFTSVQEKSIDNEDGAVQWILQEYNALQPIHNYFYVWKASQGHFKPSHRK